MKKFEIWTWCLGVFLESSAYFITRLNIICWKAPNVVGATSLDLAKSTGALFSIIMPCKSLTFASFTAMNSVFFMKKSEHSYIDLSKKPQSVSSHFGSSNYSHNLFLYNENIKRVYLRFRGQICCSLQNWLHLSEVKALLCSIKKSVCSPKNPIF